ncbi:MAG: type III-B CRISPR module-associated protein Cmr5 [Acidobacteriota bacterium]|jgi:CRISPR-associated protein Cmr5
MPHTTDQLRAVFAYRRVQEAARQTGLWEKYQKASRAASALAMGNGLMQALLFLKDKDEGAGQLAEDVLAWLEEQNLVTSNDGFSARLHQLAGADVEQFLHATQEALEILKWIKQFARAQGE